MESPGVLIGNNGAYFIEKKLEALLKKYMVHHKYVLGSHPLMSSQVKNSNRVIKIILEKIVARSRKYLVDKLDDVLWDYRMAFKIFISTMPFGLIYGKPCHLPDELEDKAYWAV